jgi:hypothetical protein
MLYIVPQLHYNSLRQATHSQCRKRIVISQPRVPQDMKALSQRIVQKIAGLPMIRVSTQGPVWAAFPFRAHAPMTFFPGSTLGEFLASRAMVAPATVRWHPSRAFAVDALVPDRSRINRCTRKTG